jgi:hypothetical protein
MGVPSRLSLGRSRLTCEAWEDIHALLLSVLGQPARQLTAAATAAAQQHESSQVTCS